MRVELREREAEPAVVEHDPRPIVALPRPALPGALIAAGALVAALLLFLFLDAQRSQVPNGSPQPAPTDAFAPPPPLVVAPEAIPQTVAVAPPAPVIIPRAPTPLPPPPLPANRSAPVTEPPPPPPPEPYYRPLPPPRPAPVVQSRQSSSPALVLDAGSSGITVGTLIPAVLETPIDTSRPGLARAIVSQDVRGQGSQRVLVPRGSRLIGEYQSDVRSGQNRVLVNWTQLIRPDGLTIRLASPAADAMGGAGIPGRVKGFFLSRFLDSALQTALTLGGNLASRRGGNTVIVGLPAGTTNVAAGQNLLSTDSRRKITVKPGTTFNVFVARELDLAGSTPPITGAATPVTNPPVQQ